MSFTLTGTNLDAPGAAALAGWYRRLPGCAVKVNEPGWVVLRSPARGVLGLPITRGPAGW